MAAGGSSWCACAVVLLSLLVGSWGYPRYARRYGDHGDVNVDRVISNTQNELLRNIEAQVQNIEVRREMLCEDTIVRQIIYLQDRAELKWNGQQFKSPKNGTNSHCLLLQFSSGNAHVQN